ncbi:MAG: Gfo/Idh/MocA family oxidoreductase [bacterium]
MMRAVLAGCGAMAKGWIEALQTAPDLVGRVDVIGLCDVDPAAADRMKQAFGLEGAVVGSDLDAMLVALRPDILFDVVVPAARHAVVSTGLRHGCHVLSEKPMAASLTEAQDLIARSNKAGRIHAVIQNRRFVPGVRRIRQAVATGLLGRLTELHADFFVGAHFGGFREAMDHVLLLDMAIHTFDAARFMAGQRPLAVFCHESNPQGSWYRQGAAARAIFEMTEDVIFTYRGSWAAEGANTSWESSWRVVGTEGTLLWDGADTMTAHRVAGTEGFFRPLAEIAIPEPDHPGDTLGHRTVLRGFLDAVAGGTAPETVGTDNIQSLAMVFAAIDSATTRQRRILQEWSQT